MTQATYKRALLGLSAVLLLALPLRAAEAPPREPGAYAVLIGVGKYSDAAIQSRPHAEDDVKALYDLFTDAKYLGIPKDHVKLLLGGAGDKERNSQEATKDNILKAAKWVADQARPDDLVILAYIGQGAALGEHGDRIAYFATDSAVKDPTKTTVLASSLADELDKLKSHKVCMFVDVYFKGYKLPDGKAPPDPNVAVGSFYKEFLGKSNSKEPDEDDAPVPGRILFLASGSGRLLSPDNDKHGVFTQVLLDGLKGKADKEGYEPDGGVTADELNTYVKAELPALLKKLIVKEKERPIPAVVSGEDAHIVLTRNPAVADEVKKRLEKFATLAKDNKFAPEIVQEGKALLERMPRLEARRKLRKEYQAFVDGKEPADKFLENRTKVLDEMKISHAAAEEFANTILKAVRLVHDQYVKDYSRGQLVEWAIRGLYKSLDEHIPDDIAKKLADAKTMRESDLGKLLTDVRERLGKREDLDNHKDIDDAILRMLHHLDPHTTFYTPEELRHAESDVSGEFNGIGIQIRQDPETDQLLVISPIFGSPAFKAGIQAGDLITAITPLVDAEGKKLEKLKTIPTKGLSINDAQTAILGKPGTPVRVTVKRKGEDKPFDVDVERNAVITECVYGYQRETDGQWNYWIDPKTKIAYIRLTQFQRNATHDLVERMNKLAKEGIKALVLDLRFDPGGYLTSAHDIADLFIDDGVIVEVRPRKEKAYVMRGEKMGTYQYEVPGTDKVEQRPLPSYTEFPMVVLVNGLSASASEIVSAALQDHHRAVLIGERTYGKGSVQQIMNFEKDPNDPKKYISKIKLTNATYWRPSGKNINKLSTPGRPEDEWGVMPDKIIPLEPSERFELEEHLRNASIIRPKSAADTETKDTFKDKQLDAALEYLRTQMKYSKKLEDARKAAE